MTDMGIVGIVKEEVDDENGGTQDFRILGR
jgi:hypothetical protein